MRKFLREDNNLDDQRKPNDGSKTDIPSIVLTAILVILCFIVPFSISSKKVENSWYDSIDKGIVKSVYGITEGISDSDIHHKRDLPIEIGRKLKFTVDRKRSEDASDLSNYVAISYGYADIEVKTSEGDTLYSSYDERYGAYIDEAGSRENLSVSKNDNLARKEKFDIIKIPSDYKGRYVEVTLSLIKDTDIAILTGIYNVDNLSELVAVIAFKEVHLVVPSVIMILIGFVGILVYTIYRLYKKEYAWILYLTQVAGLTGVMLLCQTDFVKSIFPSKFDTFYYLLYISSQLINVPIINYIVTRCGHTLLYTDADSKTKQGGKWNKIAAVSGRIIIVLTILNAIIQFVLSITGYIAYMDTILISVTLSVLTSFVFVLTSVINRDKLFRYEKWFYAVIYIMNSISMINSTYLKFHIFSYILSIETIMFIVFLISVALKYFENIGKEKMRFSLLDEALRTDNLTKLGSRYAYEHKLDELNSSDEECVIIFVDLNNLKFINDELGHEYGDEAIKGVAEYLKDNFPGSDIFRIGGDEYVIIYQDSFDYEKLSKLESKEVYVQGVTEHMPVVMSFGVAHYNPNNSKNETVEDYVKYADRAMYINKQRYKKNNPQWSYRILS